MTTTNSKTTTNKRIGLIQMSCVPDTAGQPRQSRRPRPRSRPRRSQRHLPPRALPRPILLPARRPRPLRPRRVHPRPLHRALSAIAKEEKSSSSPASSSAAPPASTTTPPPSSKPTAASRASTARCTSPTTRSTTRSSTSPPATSASKPSKTSSGRHRHARLLGPVVSRSRPPRPPSAAPNTLFYPTAIGWHPAEKAEFGDAQYAAWQTIQRAHAIANGVYVGAVNRVGHEHGDVIHNGVEMLGPGDHTPQSGLEFWGGSFIADPFGRILAQASHDKEEILIADDRPQTPGRHPPHWPFLRDRRIDAYNGITSRFLD